MIKKKFIAVCIFIVLTVCIISVAVYAAESAFSFPLLDKGQSSFSSATQKKDYYNFATVNVDSNSSVSSTAYMYVYIFKSQNAGNAISDGEMVTYAPQHFRLLYNEQPAYGSYVYLGGLRNYYGSSLYGTWEP